MKILTTLLIVLFALQFYSCQKDNNSTSNKKINTALLLGDWKLAGNYLSSGGPQYFVPSQENSTVTFGTGGSLSGTAFPTFNKYTLIDSVTIKLTQSGSAYATYLYTIKEDTLRMSPIAPAICAEGC